MAVVETALDWDYVIVGSGAGGGVLAARLAEEGMRVFLIEAGGDPQTAQRMPDDYEVPAFHAFACENPALAWDFYARHYSDEAQQARDPKYLPERGGVLYPRAAALGGCTVHNAMIFMPPHDADWNEIARMTGDVSWRAEHMRRYAQRIENCGHRPVWRLLHHLGLDPTGHGWKGWLRTEKSMPLSVIHDDGLMRLVLGTAGSFTRKLPTPLLSAWRWLRNGLGDPNSRRRGGGSFEGICYTPLSTHGHRRSAVRERLLDVARRFPQNLHIEMDALVTRVLFDAQGGASGVEFLKGARLYRAHRSPSAQAATRHEVHAQQEVILCAGAFNTPKLLMLSGIGPARELRSHGIAVQVDLPGVGRNLQDRYEVTLTHRMTRPWEVLEGARWERGDALWQQWRATGDGMYGSNGAAVGVVSRSSVAATPEPDLFCMALLARFEGYFPGFSKLISGHDDHLSWAVLKGRTRNRAGSVRLRSADPLDPPLIDFAQFEEGSEGAEQDMRAMVEAIRALRELTAPLIERGSIAQELQPGSQVQSDEALAQFVRDTAWGHHASCTCPIGAKAQGGVLDSTLLVHGVSRLRVVDASAFPRIPGFFVAAAIFMLAEKAADMVLAAAHGTPTSVSDTRPGWPLGQCHGRLALAFRQIDAPGGLTDTFSRPAACRQKQGQREEKSMAYDVQQLLAMTQEQLDDLFKASPAGDIPNGEAKGTAIVAPGTVYSEHIAQIINVFGWQGKVFDAEKGLLKNKVLFFGFQAIVANVYKGESWLDGKECIVLDYSDTSMVAKYIRDEIRLISPNFYLGKVYWGKDRLIDFCLEF